MDFELDRRTRSILRALGGAYAEGYVAHDLLPHLAEAVRANDSNLSSIRGALTCPYRGLRAFYARYAFARRGRDRNDLSRAALASLDCIGEDSFEEFLGEDNAERLWLAFEATCQTRKIKNSEQLNRGLISGIAELAQEIYRDDQVGSMVGWTTGMVSKTDHVEPAFHRIVSVRGVGPKATSTFLRDIVFLFGLEDVLDPSDRIFVQPIDRWLRLVAEALVPELRDSGAPDWIIAGKIAKYARRAGVSGLRVNMGATYFGTREAREPDRLAERLDELSDLDYSAAAASQT